MSKTVNDPRLPAVNYLLSKPGTEKSKYLILITLCFARAKAQQLRRGNPEIRGVPRC
jgi:hypothetical protein